MKTLVLGSNGQLGRALADTAPKEAEITALDLPELDITNASALLQLCHKVRPGVIINAAAYTAVDQAESEVDAAVAVNTEGPRNVAAAARDVDARLIHISTDFVFDGGASTPYKPESAANPLSVYGQTKRDGEIAILDAMPDTGTVLRTAWLYSMNGGNFVKTMLRLMAERDELRIVSDQVGAPTWADSLAATVWNFAAATGPSGIFHWTDEGEVSWYEFAVAIQEEALSLGLIDKPVRIRAITTQDYPTAAKRPAYSVLDCAATCSALDLHRVQWRVNLHRMLKGIVS